MAGREKVTPIRQPAPTLEQLREELAQVKQLAQLAVELMCPKCGPAAVVRMHPELGPQPLRPPPPDLALLDAAREPAEHRHD